MKKNQGIIITGGKFKAKSMVISTENKAETISGYQKRDHKENPNADLTNLKSSLVDLLSKGELRRTVDMLTKHFEENKTDDALRAVVVQSSHLSRLELDEKDGLITYDQLQVGLARITNSLLQIVDSWIN